jgi:hypothetical protein
MLNKSSLKQGDYPFLITGCVGSDDGPPFPTYTEGLTAFGMPEFIFNTQAFGGEGCAVRIHMAFDYFIDPKNSGKLDDILKGQIIKLTSKQLSPKYLKDSPYVYCFRKVSPNFEGVKQAYGKGIVKLAKKRGWRFIQIWVDGDDFALTDEYYRSGLK